MTTFDTGDLVKLKSGGPVMTIGSGNEEFTGCTWFHPLTQDLQTATFANDQLILQPSED